MESASCEDMHGFSILKKLKDHKKKFSFCRPDSRSEDESVFSIVESHFVIVGMLHPYCFSSNGTSVKSSRDVRCTLLSLLPLFVYFFVLPSLLHLPLVFFNACNDLQNTYNYKV